MKTTSSRTVARRSAYSVLGFHEDIEKKYAFDPDEKRKRQAALKHFESGGYRALRERSASKSRSAARRRSTFLLLGKNKGFNVARLIERDGLE